MIRPRQGPAETHRLCETARGAALRCSCCGRVEVTFGNAVLSLALVDLDSMLEIIESFAVDDLPDSHPERREFLIRTQHDDAAFAFSRGEAVELRELLSGARAAMGAPDLLAVAVRGGSHARSIVH